MRNALSEFAGEVFVEEAGVVPASRAGRLVRSMDLAVSKVTEMAAAALLVAEVALLGSSTTARYVFAHPLPWSDEMASLLFIWLAVLGAVIALRRGEHMRLTAFVRNMPPHDGPGSTRWQCCWSPRF